MQSVILIVVYVLTTMVMQIGGFLVSRMVEYEWPSFGLMTFLILFMSAFGLAWPVAVVIAEAIIRGLGMVLETEQTGAATRRDMAPRRSA